MTHRYRCSKRACHIRVTKSKAPDEYIREPKCEYCGSPLYSTEKSRRREVKARKQAGTQCYCDGYPFPHAAGTLRMCRAHPKSGEHPTELEWLEYCQVVETKRGAF